MSPFYYMFDLIIVAILIFFAWRGAKKGFILSILALVSLVIAFWGAQLISTTFYKPVANVMEPAIFRQLTKSQEDSVPDAENDPELNTTVESLLESMKQNKLFTGLTEVLDKAISADKINSVQQSAAKSLSLYLAKTIAKLVLFVAGFIVLLLVLFLVGRVLNLAAKLPGISFINGLAGLVLGLVKAILIVLVLVWAGQLLGAIPQNPTTPVLRIVTTLDLGGLLNRLVV